MIKIVSKRAMLLEGVNCLIFIQKVNIFSLFKLWCFKSCKVGENGFYSECECSRSSICEVIYFGCHAAAGKVL